MRYAEGVRALLVVSVALGVVSAMVVIAQAILLAGILAVVIIGGQGLTDVQGRLNWLGVVIAVRAALAWTSEEVARRSATSVTAGLRRDLLVHAAALGPGGVPVSMAANCRRWPPPASNHCTITWRATCRSWCCPSSSR